jgi:hypothetical protein
MFRDTWALLLVVMACLFKVHSEPTSGSDGDDRLPSKEDYTFYDLLGRTKPNVQTILNFKTWSEEKSTKFHRKLYVVIYYSKKQCLQCEHRETVLQEVMERFHPQVEFWRYNCDEEFDHESSKDSVGRYKVDTCQKNYPARLPTISFMVPETNVYFPYDPNTFTAPVYEPDFTNPNSLADMISSYMPVYAKWIKNMDDVNHYIEKFGHLSKALYFLNSEEVPIYFKGLTATFKDRLEVSSSQ